MAPSSSSLAGRFFGVGLLNARQRAGGRCRLLRDGLLCCIGCKACGGGSSSTSSASPTPNIFYRFRIPLLILLILLITMARFGLEHVAINTVSIQFESSLLPSGGGGSDGQGGGAGNSLHTTPLGERAIVYLAEALVASSSSPSFDSGSGGSRRLSQSYVYSNHTRVAVRSRYDVARYVLANQGHGVAPLCGASRVGHSIGSKHSTARHGALQQGEQYQHPLLALLPPAMRAKYEKGALPPPSPVAGHSDGSASSSSAAQQQQQAAALCLSEVFAALAGDVDALPYTPELSSGLPTMEDGRRAGMVQRLLEGFTTMPWERGATEEEGEGSAAPPPPNAKVVEEAGAVGGGAPAAHSLPRTASEQCLRNAHLSPVLSLDTGAFLGGSSSSNQRSKEAEGGGKKDNINTNNAKGASAGANGNDATSTNHNRGASPTGGHHGTRATGVLRSVAYSTQLETMYGFSNKDLTATTTTTMGTAEQSGIGGGASSSSSSLWGHATFYEGPASDSEAHLVNPRAFASRRVTWVPSGGGRRGRTTSTAGGQPSHEAEGEHYSYWADYDDELEDGNMPCTQYVQHRLHALMNPRSCSVAGAAGDSKKKRASGAHKAPQSDDDVGDGASSFDPFEAQAYHSDLKFLVTRVRAPPGCGGGCVITDGVLSFLAGILHKRVVVMLNGDAKNKFANDVCRDAGRYSLECYWQSWSRCQSHAPTAADSIPKVSDWKGAASNVRRPYISVSRGFAEEMPSDEDFFGDAFVARRPKCYQKYRQWVANAGNTFVRSQHPSAASPRHIYMQAQAMRFMQRHQQPWFHNMLAQGLGAVGVGEAVRRPSLAVTGHAASPSSSSSALVVAPPSSPHHSKAKSHYYDPIIFLHARGEPAKFKEYYDAFGFLYVKPEMLVTLTHAYCSQLASSAASGGGGEASLLAPQCRVYLSGNIPKDVSSGLVSDLRQLNVSRIVSRRHNGGEGDDDERGGGIYRSIHSVWDAEEKKKRDSTKSSSSSKKAVARYGASGPASGWIDLYAGAAASHWACVAQSNWCAMVNLMRLMNGRGVCQSAVDLGVVMLGSQTLRDRYCVVPEGLGAIYFFLRRIKLFIIGD